MYFIRLMLGGPFTFALLVQYLITESTKTDGLKG